jgi:hypothetical protein
MSGMADREARERYAAGLPDHHNPLRGVGGAPPAYSPLTLRLVLAIFGLVVCTAGAVAALVIGVWGLGAVLIVLAAIAAMDIVVIARRKGRGEPG